MECVESPPFPDLASICDFVSFLAYSVGLDVRVVAAKKWSAPLLSFAVDGKAGDNICSTRFARCVGSGTLIVATTSGGLKIFGAENS